MGELMDKAKGKTKEIAGVASNDRELEAEGKTEQVKGKVKEKFEELKHAIKGHGRKDPATRE